MAKAYRANFRSQEYRPSRGPNSVLFGAADDTVAAAVAAELGSWTTGQLTSLMVQNVFNRIPSYPLGSRITANAVMQADDGSVWRQRVLNATPGISDAAWAALFKGAADSGSGVVALTDPPKIPGGGVITTVTTAQVVKYGS